MVKRLQTAVAAVEADAIAWRRHLHRHPELSYEEKETAAFVAQRLRDFGLDPQTEVGGGYGVVARLKGGRPGPTIAFRADMDALAITEETGLEYASVRPGLMHACGHDIHTEALLGAACALQRLQPELCGEVVFVFQPAEEIPPGGAQGMLEAGVLEGVEAAFGLHISNLVPAGQIGFLSGPVFASSDWFKVRLQGRAAHVAAPHLAIDPVAMLGAAITGIQNITSRMVNPFETAVISLAWVRGGDANGIIPEAVEFGGSVRSFDPAVRQMLIDKLKTVVESAAAMFGGEATLQVTRGYPAFANDQQMTRVARAATSLVLGAERAVPGHQTMGGEDFAYFAQRVPVCYARLGTGTPETAKIPLHNPRFVADERGVAAGIAYYVGIAAYYHLEVSSE